MDVKIDGRSILEKSINGEESYSWRWLCVKSSDKGTILIVTVLGILCCGNILKGYEPMFKLFLKVPFLTKSPTGVMILLLPQ